jgi:hypothetical protein
LLDIVEEFAASIYRVIELGSGTFWIFSLQYPHEPNSVTLKMEAVSPLKY